MSKKVRILSLDGGGIRGIIPATVLEYVEKQLIEKTNNPNARLADFFDIIVGTSTGGILACFYLTPNPNTDSTEPSSKYIASEALELYSKKGELIFEESRRKSWFGLRQIFNATRYRASNLEKIFKEEFGELKFDNLIKPCVVTTYDMEKQSSFFFNSREELDKKRSFYLKDVARSTSAAPTYFAPAKIKNLITGDKMTNLDGGVFANNPSMCAYAECRTSEFKQIKFPNASNMLFLSIGTGGGQLHFPKLNKVGVWNVIKWAKSAPDIMMDGSIDTVHYQMKQLFETVKSSDNISNYKRIDVPLKKRKYDSDMSNASENNIQALKKAGEEALKEALKSKENEKTLDTFIDLLIENQ
jgi:patatin-like phospholipase/acyl hydrolase